MADGDDGDDGGGFGGSGGGGFSPSGSGSSVMGGADVYSWDASDPSGDAWDDDVRAFEKEAWELDREDFFTEYGYFEDEVDSLMNEDEPSFMDAFTSHLIGSPKAVFGTVKSALTGTLGIRTAAAIGKGLQASSPKGGLVDTAMAVTTTAIDYAADPVSAYISGGLPGAPLSDKAVGAIQTTYSKANAVKGILGREEQVAMSMATDALLAPKTTAEGFADSSGTTTNLSDAAGSTTTDTSLIKKKPKSVYAPEPYDPYEILSRYN